jgi:hypothetical protein
VNDHLKAQDEYQADLKKKKEAAEKKATAAQPSKSQQK